MPVYAARLAEIQRTAIGPALAILPAYLDTPRARVMLCAIALQESDGVHRRQHGDGPARGLWQFERGTRASRGGAWGVYLHSASTELLRQLARARGVAFDPLSMWAAAERDDVFAAGMARLLLWTDSKPLPEPTPAGEQAGWECYAERTWRPGRPHPKKWSACWAAALQAVIGAGAA